ncbi:RimK family alpha-L-glutamate ligase [Aurantimonas sp. C2-6-R+9]|uniref:RimK family alpha-L-glutamate ligase n=1 Tax=unclassified Aurantimonas TaxID=2638230 RepID=UPI002E17D5DF|nr:MULTISPECIES: RimK family alpha-L-glutamate ligase [unclassified Aurantimonas]MEC5290315.1 RimK family alpha-L-glutamate ligase [Aurantimonas sp. C2-3-R2]MEC5379853.1 RimK family alpha-L-glutamate ligase [Aurantimonas sp. C2-6-R+9]MEC5411428.1 RimK family alpha-L-glutamate ligase [Aurantimonas sp. C2-4-R8]
MIDAPSLGPVRILLVTAQVDRHARELIQAFGNLGAQVNTTGLAEIGFDTGSASGLAIPHFGGSLPDAVCVRTMDAGSFEQVTRRLGVLHALTRLGVLVSNDARAIENCVDKSMTSFLIARAGLPSPRSFAVETRAEALRIMAAEADPLVLKPLFGAQGNGLKLIHTADDLPGAEEIAGGVYYLQRFAGVETAGRWSDVRILVSAGRAAASMRRQAASWITNVKQGAEPMPMPPDGDLEALAVAATEAVGGDFCGVDLLRDAAGRAQIIEVNSMPAWTGLKKATGCDLAAIRARDLLAQVEARRAASAFRPLSAAE